MKPGSKSFYRLTKPVVFLLGLLPMFWLLLRAFEVGDFVIARNGSIWICTVAGTPGTWAEVGAAAATAAVTVTAAGTATVAATVTATVTTAVTVTASVTVTS